MKKREKWGPELEWPDAGIKSSPNLPIGGIEVTEYLGYFCKEICHQELSKIAQSGHTARNGLLRKYKQLFQNIYLAK